MTRKPIRFCSFPTYRRFSWWWWNDLLGYLIGIEQNIYQQDWWRISVHRPGWMMDIYTYWHRARYGWAPKDVWDLDYHLNHLLAETLTQLAERTHGYPTGYRSTEAWQADLRRWAQVFSEDPNDVKFYEDDQGYQQYRAEEKRRRDAIHQALKELEPWWDALWD